MTNPSDKPLFLFKQKSFDFIVEEKLPFELTGKGDAFFVYFEKQNQTTMGIINYLCQELKISRLTLWVAGLKDKDAITRQWISIYQSALKRIWGEKVFLNTLSQVARIIETTYHEKPVQMTDDITNRFAIRLRATQAIGQETKQRATRIVEGIFKDGFPNFFGTQRFGINGKNREIGKKIVEKKTSLKDNFEERFKLQAYASWLFNQYLKERLPLGNEILEGEIIKDGEITWPVFWDDILLAKPNTKAWEFQKAFMQKYQINQTFFDCYKKHKLFWIPRAIWVVPTDTQVRYQGDDLLIDFSLPSGSYASILIYQMLDKLEKLSKKHK
jgi:tRNA(Glu) U13 pseudouridine synthase TruD